MRRSRRRSVTRSETSTPVSLSCGRPGRVPALGLAPAPAAGAGAGAGGAGEDRRYRGPYRQPAAQDRGWLGRPSTSAPIPGSATARRPERGRSGSAWGGAVRTGCVAKPAWERVHGRLVAGSWGSGGGHKRAHVEGSGEVCASGANRWTQVRTPRSGPRCARTSVRCRAVRRPKRERSGVVGPSMGRGKVTEVRSFGFERRAVSWRKARKTCRTSQTCPGARALLCVRGPRTPGSPRSPPRSSGRTRPA